MSRRTKRTLRRVAVLAAGATLVMGTPAAQARTVTFHFYEKVIALAFFGPDGRPAAPPPAGPPVAGSRFVLTNDDFAGNHLHHAKQFSATDRLACTYLDGMGKALCSGQIAIGGSMLLSNEATVVFTARGAPPVPLNGGTGIFRHARGTATAVAVGRTLDSDFTVRVAY